MTSWQSCPPARLAFGSRRQEVVRWHGDENSLFMGTVFVDWTSNGTGPWIDRLDGMYAKGEGARPLKLAPVKVGKVPKDDLAELGRQVPNGTPGRAVLVKEQMEPLSSMTLDSLAVSGFSTRSPSERSLRGHISLDATGSSADPRSVRSP